MNKNRPIIKSAHLYYVAVRFQTHSSQLPSTPGTHTHKRPHFTANRSALTPRDLFNPPWNGGMCLTGRKQTCNATPTFHPSMHAGNRTHIYSSTWSYPNCTTISIQELISSIQLQPKLRFAPPIYNHVVTRFKNSGACFYPKISPSAIALVLVAILFFLSVQLFICRSNSAGTHLLHLPG